MDSLLNPEIDLLGDADVGLPEEESIPFEADDDDDFSSEDQLDVIDTYTMGKAPY